MTRRTCCGLKMPPYTHVATHSLDVIAWGRDAAVQGIREMGMGKIACLYLLIDTAGRKAYVGETGDVAERIARHCRRGPCSGVSFKFDIVAIVWDGRPILTTRFNDGTVRKALEAVLIKALAARGRLLLVNSSVSRAGVGMVQDRLVEAITGELEEVRCMVDCPGSLAAAVAGRGSQSHSL